MSTFGPPGDDAGVLARLTQIETTLAQLAQLIDGNASSASESLGQEAEARGDGDQALQGSVNAEQDARESAVQAVLDQLGQEIVARQTGDDSANGSIVAERQARLAAVQDLVSQLIAEAQAREAGDLLNTTTLAQAVAQTAADRQAADSSAQQAVAAAVSAGRLFASTGDALSKGASVVTPGAPGSGGTDGTYPAVLTGGNGTGMAIDIVVAGGAVTNYVLRSRGINYTAAPAIGFGNVPGLAGATATVSIAVRVPDGETFLLIGSGDTLYTLYKNVAGVATSLGLVAPTKLVVDTLSSLLGTGNAPDASWIEWGQAEYGTVLWYRTAEMLLERAIQAETLTATGRLTATEAAIGGFLVDATGAGAGDVVEMKVGEYGVAFWAMLGDGTELPEPSAGGGSAANILDYSDVDRAARQPDGVNRFGDYTYVPLYGESTAVGSQGYPAISTTPKYSNKMPLGGVKALLASGTTTLVDLVEDNNAEAGGAPNNIHGETGCLAMCATASEYLLEYHGIDPATRPLITSAPGQGGQRFDQLAKGTTPYARLVRHRNAVLAAAAAEGKTCSIPAVVGHIGANDAFQGTSRADVAARLSQLATDIDADLRPAGQTFPVRLLFYVPSGAGAPAALEQVILGIYDAAAANPLIQLVGPWYDLPFGDGVHLTNQGYRHAGRKEGIHLARYLIEGRTRSLRPVSAWSYGQTVCCGFTEAIAIDAVNLPLATQYGVKLVDASGNNALSSFSVEGGVLKCLASRPIVAPARLRISLDYLGAGLTVGQSGQGKSSNLRGAIVHHNRQGGNLTPEYRWAAPGDLPLVATEF